MRKPLLVIKLGGSAVTDRSHIYTPRIIVLAQAAKQVAEIAKKRSVVLVHGAGSYGHIPVTEYGLARGFKSAKQLRGLTVTKSKLLEWEAIFDQVFVEHRVPVAPCVASDFIVAKRGRIISVQLNSLKGWLRLGCVPTMGGDIVPDAETGFSIVSGDQLAACIATKLKASKLIFGTDVDGIFNANPKLDRKAALLRELTPSDARRLAKDAMTTTYPDVTGGMGGKMREAAAAASRGVDVYFVNLTKGTRLLKAAFGQRVLCSRIRAS